MSVVNSEVDTNLQENCQSGAGDENEKKETVSQTTKVSDSDNVVSDIIVEKSDSGMDEDSGHHLPVSDLDSDEEIVVRKKSTKKSKMVIDDEDSGPEERSDPGDTSEVEDVSHKTQPTKFKKIKALEDSDDEAFPGSSTSKDAATLECDELNDSREKLNLSFKENKDVFEAESSDEDFPGISGHGDTEDDKRVQSNNEDSSNSEAEGDEGFDEVELDPELVQQLKKMKGAGKTQKQREKKERKAKPSADKMLELFSESQRLSRESRVQLPYHEPEAKSLDDFLARADKKRQEYAALRRPRDMLKAQIIHEKLSITPPKMPTPQRRRKRHSDSDKKSPKSSSLNSEHGPLSSSQLPQSASELADDELPDLVSVPSQLHSKVLSGEAVNVASEPSLSQQTMVLSQNAAESAKSVSAAITSDDLPDLNSVPINEQTLSPVTSIDSRLPKGNDLFHMSDNNSGKVIPTSTPEKDFAAALKVIPDVCESDIDAKDIPCSVPSLQKDPSRDLFQSVSSVCGDNLTPVETLNDEVSADPYDPENSLIGEKHLHHESPNKQSAMLDVISPSERPQDKTPQSKKRLFSKLGIELPPPPSLKGTPDQVICLDEPATPATPQNPGLQKLMERLARHSKKISPKRGRDVDISIIEKETCEEGDKTELRLKTLTYHVEEEKTMDSTQPGAKLLMLKKHLGQGMRKKRDEARKKREQMYALENEEGFGRVEEEGGELVDEEELAEMTDGESDSESEDDINLQLGNISADSDDGKDYNPLLDDEARDDDDEDGAEYNSDFHNEDSNDVHLHFDVSEEEEEEEEEKDNDEDSDNDDFAITSSKKKKLKRKHAPVIDSDNETGDEDDEKKNNHEEKYKAAPIDPWADELSPLTKHLQDTQSQRRQYRCESRSPDLYSQADTESVNESTSGRNFDHMNDSSQSMGYAHSQMLDADGFLKTTQTSQKPRSLISQLAQHSNDECSARDGFDLRMTAGGLFNGADDDITPSAIFQQGGSQAVSQDISASAVFRGATSQFPGSFGQDSLSEDAFPISQNRSEVFNTKNQAEKKSNPFVMLSDDEEDDVINHKWKKQVLSDSEDGETRDSLANQGSDGSEVEEEVQQQKFTGFRKKKKGIRQDFVEDEAELSGSECESDENLDLALEEDILEEEAGDRDMAGVSEEALRKQVGKVHMKQLQHDDDREVMRLKEMYLQDGDLYTDGAGRMRNFKWKDIDESSQQDMFGDAESDPGEDEEALDEAQWRKDRMEREKFLEESQKEDEDPTEPATLLRIGSFCKSKDNKMPLAEIPTKPAAAQSKPKLGKKGSFLTRSKDALVKIAQVAKGAFGAKSTGKSKAFVFQTVGEADQDENKESVHPQPLQPPKRKAREAPSTPAQAAKKQKTDNTPTKPQPVKRTNSVFSLLEQK